MATTAKGTKKPRKKPEPPSGPAVVVLLSSLREIGVVKAVAKNHKTTDRPRFVRDFKSREKAAEFIKRGYVPAGWRGHVEVIDRGSPGVQPPPLGGYTQASLPSF